MKKTEFEQKLIENLGREKVYMSERQVRKCIAVMFDTIADVVVGDEKLTISGFGSFEKVIRKARVGRNMISGEPVVIPETASVKFTPSQILKNHMQK